MGGSIIWVLKHSLTEYIHNNLKKDSIPLFFIRNRPLFLTLCILKNVPIHIDTISIGLSTVYFNGSQVELSKLWCSFVPDEMPHYAAFHLGLNCLTKYQFRGFQYTKGLSK